MKKIFALVLVFMSATMMFCGCQSGAEIEERYQRTMDEQAEKSGWHNLVDIQPQDELYKMLHLVYDDQTFIVYYYDGWSSDHKAVAYMCPYYSNNGYLCRYNTDTKQIEEIIH